MTDFTGGTWRSLVDGAEVSAIPDSVVTRSVDGNSGSQTGKRGIRIETNVEWPEIGARISGSTSGITRAEIYRVSDDQLMGKTTFSSKSAGETFTIDLDNNLVSGETYYFVLDNQTNSYTQGFYDATGELPFTSPDGDLSIVNGASGGGATTGLVANIDKIGDVGF